MMQTPPSNRMGTFAAIVADTAITLFLVIVFFAVLLGMLALLFPIGGTSGGDVQGEGAIATRAPRSLLFNKGDTELDVASAQPLAAELTQIHNTVKSKRSGDIAWSTARSGMELYDRDAVQTARDATALITFDENNYLRVSEDSLVVIKRLQQDILLNERQSFVVMVDGELQGRVADSDKKSVYVEVATPGAVARIGSGGKSRGQAEFKIKINPDKSSTIAVYSGVAEVVAQGEVLVVGENQVATVKPGETARGPEGMLNAPQLDQPKNDARYYYRDLPPKVEFIWNANGDAHDYNLVIARDSGFRDVIVDEHLSSPHFTHGNLKDGEYYWRVRAFHPQREGAYTEAGRLVMVRDNKAPELTVRFPAISVTTSHHKLTGTTEAGSRVFVLGTEVAVDGLGGFQYLLKLKRGLNSVIVEAVDEAGNVTYRSRLINGKF